MSARTDSPPAAPGARAVARYVRTSASKARRVVNLVRGLPAKEALTVLQFAPQAASVPVYKVLASAIANAENNEQLDPDSLLVSEAYVNEGPTMRRYRPRAQMRPGPIRKRTCHITIAVEAVQPETVPAPRRPRKQADTAAAPEAPAAKKATKKAARKAPAQAAEATADAPAEASDTPADAPADAAEPPAEKPAKKSATKKATTATKAPKKAASKAETPESAAEEGTE